MSIANGVSHGSTKSRRRIRLILTQKRVTNDVSPFANTILVEAYSPEKDPAVKRLRQRLEKIR
jgi:hypothetical protein